MTRIWIQKGSDYKDDSLPFSLYSPRRANRNLQSVDSAILKVSDPFTPLPLPPTLPGPPVSLLVFCSFESVLPPFEAGLFANNV